MKYGYIRLSINEPNPEPQLKALRRAGVKTNTTYTDHVSGTKADWRYLKAALSRLQREDTFVVWRLDRLSTSLKDLIERISKFNEQGVRFIRLSAVSTPSKRWLAYKKQGHGEKAWTAAQEPRSRNSPLSQKAL